ncbi:MAG: MFS transporter [Alphaproteobacteria bacterium]
MADQGVGDGVHGKAPVSKPTKILYGIGSVAYGVKDNGFGYFLLLFYSQILGLPASLAGLALAVALVIDGFSDPLIGHMSDNWRSRMGRRHPFMYVAIIPVVLSYYLLWVPLVDPQTVSNEVLFLYMLVLSVLVRTFITVYEVPNTALVAEFTDDYDQRTSILSYRYFFGWWGGLSIAFLAYSVFLVPTEANPSGLSVQAFESYGLFACGLMLVTMLMSSIGTHHHIPNLIKPPEAEAYNTLKIFGAFWKTIADRSFLALFLSAIFFYTAAGFSAAAYNYTQFFFWELTGSEIRYMTLSHFLSAAVALMLVSRIARGREKKHVAIALSLIAVLNYPLPIVLRLIGFFPGNDSDWLLPILVVHSFLEVTVLVMMGTMLSSMIADLVEESQKKTKRRSEGLFFATRTFARKVTSGLGVFLLGIVLDLIQFPTQARPGTISDDVLFDYGIAFPMVYVVFGVASALVLLLYRISRQSHAENVRIVTAQDDVVPGA